jgi:hypothetical protein
MYYAYNITVRGEHEDCGSIASDAIDAKLRFRGILLCLAAGPNLLRPLALTQSCHQLGVCNGKLFHLCVIVPVFAHKQRVPVHIGRSAIVERRPLFVVEKREHVFCRVGAVDFFKEMHPRVALNHVLNEKSPRVECAKVHPAVKMAHLKVIRAMTDPLALETSAGSGPL